MWKAKKHTDILWVIDEIIRLHNEKKKSYKMQITGLLYTLLLKIYDVCSKGVKEKSQTENLPIMPAIEYIYILRQSQHQPDLTHLETAEL